MHVDSMYDILLYGAGFSASGSADGCCFALCMISSSAYWILLPLLCLLLYTGVSTAAATTLTLATLIDSVIFVFT